MEVIGYFKEGVLCFYLYFKKIFVVVVRRLDIGLGEKGGDE